MERTEYKSRLAELYQARKDRHFRVLLTFKEPVYLGRAYGGKKQQHKAYVLADRPTYIAPRSNARWYRDELGHSWMMDLLESVELCKKEPLLTVEQQAQRVLNRLHENMWPEIRKELQKVVDGTPDHAPPYYLNERGHGPTMASLRSKIRQKIFSNASLDHVMGSIKEVIERKEGAFRDHWDSTGWGNQGRDLSVRVEAGPDGMVRGWFSSEYPGCGNGDYWLIISPTTVLFIETD